MAAPSGMRAFMRFLSLRSSTDTDKLARGAGYLSWRRLRWMPLLVGVSYVGYQQINLNEAGKKVDNNWQVRLYRAVPLRVLSRTWGRVNELNLPEWLRVKVIRLYINMFHVNLEEAVQQDLKKYRNLGEFFRRRIKPEVRPVDHEGLLTSPADGRILCCGQVENGQVEQVKGSTYSLRQFFGRHSWCDRMTVEEIDEKNLERKMKKDEKNVLHHCVIYLSPGDYHCFHSPVNWTVAFRRHFPGELLSVSPLVVGWVKSLFCLNERAVYIGEWEHGFFSLTAVGATSVGSIHVYADQSLHTNKPWSSKRDAACDRWFMEKKVGGLQFKKGDIFGEFRLGSTVVLVFEAPRNFKFNLKPGQQIKFGQAIGSLSSSSR